MNMKTMTSKEAQNSFGHFLDTAQREPVLVTRRNRPVGVMVSITDYETITEQAEREIIRKGVIAGLEDAKAGRGEDLNAEFVANLKREILADIDIKQKAE